MKRLRHATDHRARRSAEYPPLADFVDAFVKAYAGRLNELPAPLRAHVEACLAVKARFPKTRP